MIPAQNQDRIGGALRTFSGRQFWPGDPRPEEVNAWDIAHSLSLQCRWGGHVRWFYSVAEHCVILSHIVPEEYALWALLHDASEAYCVDIPRPLKVQLPQYVSVENKIIAAVAQRFELEGTEIPEIVNQYDSRILMDEQEQLMWPSSRGWPQFTGLERLDVRIWKWSPQTAEAKYLNRLGELTATFRQDYVPIS